MKKKDSVLRDKSYKFAIRIVKLSQYLRQEKKEFDMSKQILRNGTSIGALIREAEYAQSDADFISKFSISLKEAHETAFWLSLLKDTDYMEEKMYNNLLSDCEEVLSMFVSTGKTTKSKKLLTLNS